jgi:hypothetical protein
MFDNYADNTGMQVTKVCVCYLRTLDAHAPPCTHSTNLRKHFRKIDFISPLPSTCENIRNVNRSYVSQTSQSTFPTNI